MSETGQSAQAAKKGRRQFLLMVALFLAPAVVAVVVWNYVTEHGVMGTVNSGTLVVPARPMVDVEIKLEVKDKTLLKFLSGRWTYIQFTNNGCGDDCQKQIYTTRQIRVGVNKDMKRVQRLLVSNVNFEEKEIEAMNRTHPELVRAIAGKAFSEQFEKAGYDTSGKYFFLVDPLGNLMMSYTLELNPRDIMKDLKKLLKINVVG